MAIVLAIISSVLGIGLPVLTNGADAKRTRDAASFLAGQFRLARQRAVMTGRHVAIVFDDVAEAMGGGCARTETVTASRVATSFPVWTVAKSRRSRCRFGFAQVAVGYVPGVPSPGRGDRRLTLALRALQMAVFTADRHGIRRNCGGAGTRREPVRGSRLRSDWPDPHPALRPRHREWSE